MQHEPTPEGEESSLSTNHLADGPAEDAPYTGFDRRRGPRRAGSSLDAEAAGGRRGPDRRKRKPGLSGLFGAIFGKTPDDDEAE